MTLKTIGTAVLLTAAFCLPAAHAEEATKPATPPAMGGNPQMMQQHRQEMMKQQGGMPGMQHGGAAGGMPGMGAMPGMQQGGPAAAMPGMQHGNTPATPAK